MGLGPSRRLGCSLHQFHSTLGKEFEKALLPQGQRSIIKELAELRLQLTVLSCCDGLEQHSWQHQTRGSLGSIFPADRVDRTRRVLQG